MRDEVGKLIGSLNSGLNVMLSYIFIGLIVWLIPWFLLRKILTLTGGLIGWAFFVYSSDPLRDFLYPSMIDNLNQLILVSFVGNLIFIIAWIFDWERFGISTLMGKKLHLHLFAIDFEHALRYMKDSK
jgi:hypothetical protein